MAGGAGVAGPPRHAGVTRHLSSKENDSAVVGAGRSAGSGGSAPSRQTLQHLTSGTRRRKHRESPKRIFTKNHRKESSSKITNAVQHQKQPTGTTITNNNHHQQPSSKSNHLGFNIQKDNSHSHCTPRLKEPLITSVKAHNIKLSTSNWTRNTDCT